MYVSYKFFFSAIALAPCYLSSYFFGETGKGCHPINQAANQVNSYDLPHQVQFNSEETSSASTQAQNQASSHFNFHQTQHNYQPAWESGLRAGNEVNTYMYPHRQLSPLEEVLYHHYRGFRIHEPQSLTFDHSGSSSSPVLSFHISSQGGAFPNPLQSEIPKFAPLEFDLDESYSEGSLQSVVDSAVRPGARGQSKSVPLSNYPFRQPEKPSTPLSYSVANSQKQLIELNPPREKLRKRPEELNSDAQELAKRPGDSNLLGNKITEHRGEFNLPVAKRQKPFSELSLPVKEAKTFILPWNPRVSKAATSAINLRDEAEKPGDLIQKYSKILGIMQKERVKLKQVGKFTRNPSVKAKYALLKNPPPSFPEAQGIVRLLYPHASPNAVVERELFNKSLQPRLSVMLRHLDYLMKEKDTLNSEKIRTEFERWIFMEFFEPEKGLPVVGFTKIRVDGQIDENVHFQETQKDLINIATLPTGKDAKPQKLAEEFVRKWFINRGKTKRELVEEELNEEVVGSA
ncbi:hypothetical protein O181_034160 [Austropuccinia psidii MF-1]|uniref:Uncharacterized protein n=1 Tax=Austropuccinia psidii MF-1 TaxID=1389203 RepID=A0A9Q3D2J6_9BASI|nr:hypothetical protein [Austropuccinia psidii MF-1]